MTEASNCALVPVTVFEPRATDLLVSVSVVARPTNVSVAAGRVMVEVPATADG